MAVNYTRNRTDRSVLARIRRQGRIYQTSFPISRFAGSWERAEKAARKWVKAKLLEVPAPLPVKGRRTKRNTSGVVGVRLADATRRKSGRVYPDWRWIAFWPGCPNTGGVGWSVRKYGDQRAFVCAYLARKSESVDREAIETKVLRMRNSKEYRAVLRLKRISAPRRGLTPR